MIFSSRKSTWLELFFDLLFVLTIGAFSHQIEENFSLYYIFYSIPFFFIIWWQWLQYTFFYDLYDPGEWGNWISVLLVSFLMLILSDTLPDAMEGEFRALIVVLILLRTMVAVMYSYKIIVLKLYKQFYFLVRLITNIFPILYIGMFYLDKNLDETWTYITLCGIVFLDLSFPWIMNIKPSNQKQQSHLEERIGLFMLIVIGEMVTSTALSLRQIYWNMEIMLDAFLFLGTSYFITLNYFSYIREHFFTHLFHRGIMYRGLVYLYLQSVIALCIIFLGISGLMLILNKNITLASYTYFLSLIAYIILSTITQSIVQKLRRIAIQNRAIEVAVYIVCLLTMPHARFLTFLLGFLPLFLANMYIYFTIILPKIFKKRKQAKA